MLGTQSRILISGASGLIGSELVPALRAIGMSITTLTRHQPHANELQWAPATGRLDPDVVSGFDAVIHLAGEPVGNGPWTAGKKQKIYDSRVHGTRTLAQALAAARQPPRVFLCASGINYYPDSGDRIVDENAGPGNGFLSRVCLDWEHSAELLSGTTRVVAMRIGVVLSAQGGTLRKMLPVFRLGLGGYVGTGAAYLSWITLPDLVRAVVHMLQSQALQGAVNVVSPGPVTGRRFAEALGTVLHRPARFRVPEFIARAVLGQFAEETILSSVRATPSRLLSDGFTFQSATIDQALATCIAPTKSRHA